MVKRDDKNIDIATIQNLEEIIDLIGNNPVTIKYLNLQKPGDYIDVIYLGKRDLIIDDAPPKKFTLFRDKKGEIYISNKPRMLLISDEKIGHPIRIFLEEIKTIYGNVLWISIFALRSI